MKWTTKSKIQRVCAAAPAGDRVYRVIERRFGTLDSDSSGRVGHFVAMVEWLQHAGVELDDAMVVEVGTGHEPTMPILFALGGAKVTTVDLHPRLQWDLTRSVLEWVCANSEAIAEQLPSAELKQRFIDNAARLNIDADPRVSMDALGIDYLAPADARSLPFEDGAVDVHCSTTTLEHIAPDELGEILAEAGRVIGTTGVAVHFVDLSDHFAHQDSSISPVNFLRYPAEEWERFAGNEFGYCNRLRACEYERIIERAGLSIDRSKRFKDVRSTEALRGGMTVDSAFRSHAEAELATTDFKFLARAR